MPERKVEIGLIAETEIRGKHSDHRIVSAIQREVISDNTPVCPESLRPKMVSQHDHVACAALVVFGREAATEKRIDP